MFLKICVLIQSKSKEQSFLAAVTWFNDQPLSFNRWFTRNVVVYVDLSVAWNGWVSKNTRQAAICRELWIGWAERSLVWDSVLIMVLIVCIMCVGGTWLSFSFWIIVLQAEWLVIFSLFVKFAFTAIVFITAYSLLTPTAVLLNQACASFVSLTLFTAIGSKNGQSALLQSSGLLWPNAL